MCVEWGEGGAAISILLFPKMPFIHVFPPDMTWKVSDVGTHTHTLINNNITVLSLGLFFSCSVTIDSVAHQPPALNQTLTGALAVGLSGSHSALVPAAEKRREAPEPLSVCVCVCNLDY